MNKHDKITFLETTTSLRELVDYMIFHFEVTEDIEGLGKFVDALKTIPKKQEIEK